MDLGLLTCPLAFGTIAHMVTRTLILTHLHSHPRPNAPAPPPPSPLKFAFSCGALASCIALVTASAMMHDHTPTHALYAQFSTSTALWSAAVVISSANVFFGFRGTQRKLRAQKRDDQDGDNEKVTQHDNAKQKS